VAGGRVHREPVAGGSRGSGRTAAILEPLPGDPGTAACCPSVLAAPLGAEEAADLARTLAAVADPVRLQVLSILAASPAGEVCVCELVGPLGKSQPTVSHHLKVLGEAGLVHGERRGRWVWYSLDRERLGALQGALGA
jgi:ArsR family transcriptional regulator